MPIGLMGLADNVSKSGYTTQIIHLGVELIKNKKIDLEQIIKTYNPTFIGLDLHWHFQSYDVIQISQKIKALNSEIKILIGGITASYYADEIMENYNSVDFIIKGEAELPIIKLLDAVIKNDEISSVPNLLYRNKGKLIYNEQTFIADEKILIETNYTNFSLVKDYETYVGILNRWYYNEIINKLTRIEKSPSGYSLVLGRGCVRNCYFCGGSQQSHKIISKREKVTTRSVDSTIASIQDLVKYGFSYIMISYDPDPPQISEKYYIELFKKIKELNIQAVFSIERWYIPTKEFMISMKENLHPDSNVELSLTTYNESLRKRNNIYFYSNKDLEKCLDELERYNIRTYLFFALGVPYETGQDVIDMKRYQDTLLEKHPMLSTSTRIIEIEPCSDMVLHPDKYNLIINKKSFMDYYNYHSLSKKNFFEEMGYIRKNCFDVNKLNKMRCKMFCPFFKSMPLIKCNILFIFHKLGIISLMNKLLSLYPSRKAS